MTNLVAEFVSSPGRSVQSVQTERGKSTRGVAHELVHALNQDGVGTPADCLNDEITAFEYQGLAWESIAKRYPGAQGSSALARHHDDITTAWITRGLSEAVLRSPGYQTQCLGGTISDA